MPTCPQCQSTNTLLKSATQGQCRNCRARFTIRHQRQEWDDHSQQAGPSKKDGKRAMYNANKDSARFTANKRARYEDDSDTEPARIDRPAAIKEEMPSSSSSAFNTRNAMVFSLSSKPNHNTKDTSNGRRRRDHTDDDDDDDDDDAEDDLLEKVKREELDMIDDDDYDDDDDTQDTDSLLQHFTKRFAKPSAYKATGASIDFDDEDDDDMIDEDVSNLGINDSRNTRATSSRKTNHNEDLYTWDLPIKKRRNEDLYTWDLPIKKRRNHGRMKKQAHSSQRPPRHRYDDDSESDFQPEGDEDDDDDEMLDSEDEELPPQRRPVATRYLPNQSQAFKRPLVKAAIEQDDTEYDAAPPIKRKQKRANMTMDTKPTKKPKPMTRDSVSVDVVSKVKRDKGKEKAFRPDPMFSDEEDYIASDYEQTSFVDGQSQRSTQAPEEPMDPVKAMHTRKYVHKVPRPGNKYNPYLLFNTAMRKEIIATDALSNKEVSQKISQMWRDLPEEEKQKYRDESKRLKEEFYDKQREQKPKLPPNSFVLFSRDMYPKLKEENPDLKFQDINTIVTRKWKELDEASKNVYQERSLEARQKFMEENAEYYKKFLDNNIKKAQLTKKHNKEKYQELADWYNKH